MDEVLLIYFIVLIFTVILGIFVVKVLKANTLNDTDDRNNNDIIRYNAILKENKDKERSTIWKGLTDKEKLQKYQELQATGKLTEYNEIERYYKLKEKIKQDENEEQLMKGKGVIEHMTLQEQQQALLLMQLQGGGEGMNKTSKLDETLEDIETALTTDQKDKKLKNKDGSQMSFVDSLRIIRDQTSEFFNDVKITSSNVKAYVNDALGNKTKGEFNQSLKTMYKNYKCINNLDKIPDKKPSIPDDCQIIDTEYEKCKKETFSKDDDSVALKTSKHTDCVALKTSYDECIDKYPELDDFTNCIDLQGVKGSDCYKDISGEVALCDSTCKKDNQSCTLLEFDFPLLDRVLTDDDTCYGLLDNPKFCENDEFKKWIQEDKDMSIKERKFIKDNVSVI
jgi:hypothetical protein